MGKMQTGFGQTLPDSILSSTSSSKMTDSPYKDVPHATRSIQRTALSILTNLQRLPTPFISAFLLVHLTAPVVANVGGSQASSQVMVRARKRLPLRSFSDILVYNL